MQQVSPAIREIRLRWLVPILVLLSLWVNFSIANASSLHVDQFAPVVVRPARLANYAQDPANLAFPAVDPQLYEQVLQDQALGSAGQGFTQPGGPGNPSATPSPMATGTPQPGQPSATPEPGMTLPGVLPTTVGAIPTVIGVVPTVIGALPTVIGAVPTVIGAAPTVIAAVPTVVGAVPTLVAGLPTTIASLPTLAPLPTLPVCVPLPPLIFCP